MAESYLTDAQGEAIGRHCTTYPVKLHDLISDMGMSINVHRESLLPAWEDKGTVHGYVRDAAPYGATPWVSIIANGLTDALTTRYGAARLLAYAILFELPLDGSSVTLTENFRNDSPSDLQISREVSELASFLLVPPILLFPARLTARAENPELSESEIEIMLADLFKVPHEIILNQLKLYGNQTPDNHNSQLPRLRT